MQNNDINAPISDEEFKKITEELYKRNLELANLYRQRESLMHLITHKVKGSFTHSKYIFAGILDGTFGDANDEIKRRAQQGLDSDDGGLKTIDLVLNAANMQQGLIKYDLKPIDFSSIVTALVVEKKLPAETKGLALESRIETTPLMVMGDAFWLKEAVNNLVENSIKYTLKGKIVISLSKKDGAAVLTVADTGVGINEEDKANLFKEGGRGKNSVKVNVDSTGYGLYSVKMILEAHKGKVSVASEGEGKGSTFTVELSLIS
jgi:signal transduction histidine kinase